jgi:regulator-associated protein of mTOR
VLSVGIFPYVQKLLACTVNDLRLPLAFIWAKILTVDSQCRLDLTPPRDAPNGGIDYFVKMMQSGLTAGTDVDGRPLSAHQKIVPAYVLAVYIDNNLLGQKYLFNTKIMVTLVDYLIECECARAQQWTIIVMARLWTNYDEARWYCIRATAHEHLLTLAVTSTHVHVRAAAIFALGTLVSNRASHNEHATDVSRCRGRSEIQTHTD